MPADERPCKDADFWSKIEENTTAGQFAEYLKNEYPQTVAVILAKLNRLYASNVIGLLPENFAAEVAIRIVSMEQVSESVIIDVMDVLEEDLSKIKYENFDSIGVLGGLLENNDRLMNALEERNVVAANQVKERLKGAQ